MAKRDPFLSLRNTEFCWFLLMRLGVVLGWSIQFVLVEWEVYRMTKDPFSLGLIGLMEVIPALTIALFAGYIVDQNEKKRMLSICFSGTFMVSILMCVLFNPSVEVSLSKNIVLYSIYGLSFIGGIIRAFVIPSVFSLLSLIVKNEEKPNASAWSSSMWQISAVAGPAIAGFTIGWMGVFNSMLMVVFCMLFGIFALLQISTKPIMNPKIGEPIFKSLKEGISFVFKNKMILGALSLDMFAVLFGGAIALLPIFAQEILKQGSEGFGILRAAPAVGGLITMLAATYIPLHQNAGKKVLMAVFGFGVCIIIFGLSKNFWVSVIALFFSGVTDGFSVVIRQTILQLYTPDHMRGRVSSVNSIFVGSSNELGAFESGFMARVMGIVPSVIFGGIMTLVTVIVTAVSVKEFRNLNINLSNIPESK